MSEGTHFTTVQNKKRAGSRWMLALAGTAVVIVTAGVLFQVFRAEEGTAAETEAADTETSGRTSLQASNDQKALARVNSEPISYDVVARECMARYGQEVLENIINRMIIHQACREKGIEISKEQVDGEVTKIAQKFNLDVDGWYAMLQKERNLTPTQYRNDIIWPMLALKQLAGTEITPVTEEDLKRAFIRDYGPRVKAKMIMLDNPRRAQQVWEQANKKDQDFGRLAREHSMDPSSRALEGEIPPIRRYAGADNLEKAAFKLKEGEISGIIDMTTPDKKMFVILQCQGRTEPVVTDIAQVQETLQAQLEEERVQSSVAKIFDKLKKEARVDNLLTGTSTGGVQQTAGKLTPGQVRPAAATARAAKAPATRTE
ncbi:MAG: peptidylprolyl isomerase [Planctomycetaceae bacterium]